MVGASCGARCVMDERDRCGERPRFQSFPGSGLRAASLFARNANNTVDARDFRNQTSSSLDKHANIICSPLKTLKIYV
jgi:hypothetical protein